MYAVKVASRFPELIEAMYIDAPVMNLLSCPADLGIAKGGLFDEYFRVMKVTKSELLSYRDNPIDVMHVLVENDIPIVMVSGDSDTVVPYVENGGSCKNNINSVLETMKLLDALYTSSDKKEEIKF